MLSRVSSCNLVKNNRYQGVASIYIVTKREFLMFLFCFDLFNVCDVGEKEHGN